MAYDSKPRPFRLLLALPLLAAALPTAATEVEAPCQMREALLQSTGRIRYEREENGCTITGHGTAFGVDLAQYGFAGRRYLLTAAHNVLDDRKKPHGTLKVEIPDGTRTYWSRCRAVVWDENLDLCLIEAGDDMPSLLRIADSDLRAGSRLTLAGSPRGVPVKLFAGTLDQKFERGTVRSSAIVPFDHGDSGGPIVDTVSGRVVGVAVAGVPKDGDLDHNIGLFVPTVGITSFLDANRRGAPVASPLRDAPAVATSVARTLEPAPASIAVASPKPSAASIVEFLEPGADAKGPRPEQAVAVKASAPVSAVAAPSPALIAEPKPVAAQERAASQGSSPASVSGTALPETGNVYVVQKGDNLTKIARQCNVSVNDMVKVNGLKDPNRLLVGAKLVLPMN